MRALVKNIKGFNLIELLVVIAIIGIISAVGYPNFTAWSKEREVRLAVEKINSLIKNTHAQTEKGTFAFVQIKFTNNADSLTVEGKGMTMSSLANKINDINDIWNRDASSRCDVQSTTYWDTDTAAETGHLVFGTLHTSGAPNTINRIIDVFPPEQQAQIRAQISTSLKMVVTQRLLKTKDGQGRCGAFEVMKCTAPIQNLIREAKIHQIPSIMQTAVKDGMITMSKSLENLVTAGKIDANAGKES